MTIPLYGVIWDFQHRDCWTLNFYSIFVQKSRSNFPIKWIVQMYPVCNLNMWNSSFSVCMLVNRRRNLKPGQLSFSKFTLHCFQFCNTISMFLFFFFVSLMTDFFIYQSIVTIVVWYFKQSNDKESKRDCHINSCHLIIDNQCYTIHL